MKTLNEFRVGNKILVPNIESTVLIPSIEVEVQGITIFGEIECLNTPQHAGLTISTKKVSGIKLTEEWFLRYGFIHDKEEEIFNRHDICFSYSENYKGYKLYVQHEYEIGREIEYVHELQNLYFALKGEEIKFLRLTHVSGVSGIFIKEYTPTGKPDTTMIKCDDGKIFFAPSSEFKEMR